MNDHLIKCDTCGKLMYPGSLEHGLHACWPPQPPTVSSSQPVGEVPVTSPGCADAAILHSMDFVDGDRGETPVGIARCSFIEGARWQAARSQAREQRLLTAFEGLIKELDTAEGRARDERWNSTADAYKYAAEWAVSALEKAKGEKE